MDSLVYGIIGKVKHRGGFTQQTWAVCYQVSPDDADNMIKALDACRARFASWKLTMMKNNSHEMYEDLIADYIEAHMLDTNFVEGVEYEILVFNADPRAQACAA